MFCVICNILCLSVCVFYLFVVCVRLNYANIWSLQSLCVRLKSFCGFLEGRFCSNETHFGDEIFSDGE